MNIHVIAAEIARRIPDMAKDSPTNNETVILNLLRGEQDWSPGVGNVHRIEELDNAPEAGAFK